MNIPVRSMVAPLTSCSTRFAPMAASTAPSTSQISAYLAVMPVLLKPGCSMSTGTPCALSSCASSIAPMLHAARL
eukprot:4244311-Prymnesium_polylepis.2